MNVFEQPPLIDSDPELPSPLFKPRPGWGGRFKGWFEHNTYTIVFRTLILVVVAVIVVAITRAIPSRNREASAPSPTPPILTSVNTYTAQPGDGTTNLAARALDAFLASRKFTMTPAEHLFAVDTLARNAGWHPLNLGDQVGFSELSVADIYSRAKALTPSQRAAWSRYLR